VVAAEHGAVVLDGELGVAGAVQNAVRSLAEDKLVEDSVKVADADRFAMPVDP